MQGLAFVLRGAGPKTDTKHAGLSAPMLEEDCIRFDVNRDVVASALSQLALPLSSSSPPPLPLLSLCPLSRLTSVRTVLCVLAFRTAPTERR